MGYIDFEEREPVLFESQVRRSMEDGHGVCFRSTELKEWIVVQRGPIPDTFSIVLPPFISRTDMERLVLCLRIFKGDGHS